MKGLAKYAGASVLAALIFISTGCPAWGAEPLDRVAITVSSQLEGGDGLPDIDIQGDKDQEVSVSVTSDWYTVLDARWLTSAKRGLEIGDEPRMQVTLTPVDEKDHYFLSSYKVKDVRINGGVYVTSRRDGSDLVVTLKLRPVKGTYEQPDEAYWKETRLGMAVWEDDTRQSSSAYEVWLYRGKKIVTKVAQTKGLTYNFYPYMTQEGTYTFQVRIVPYGEQAKKSGKSSQWTQSGELLIGERDVSDGTGKDKAAQAAAAANPTDMEKLGWAKEGATWRYYYEKGVAAKGTWLKIQGLWYLFNVDGGMLTGWRQMGGNWYYLSGSGAMVTGWLRLGGKWYFLHTDPNGPEGAMLTGWQVVDGRTYYFQQDGSAYLGWLQQDGRWYYFNTLEGSLQGALLKGWIRRDGNTYYSDEYGVMQTGWVKVDGNWHYFYPSTGAEAFNTSINGFYVDADGIYKE